MNSDILKPNYFEKLSELLLDNVSDAIISTDKHFRIQTWNKATEKIYGITLCEAIGKITRDIFNYEFLNDSLETSRKKLIEEGTWKGIVVFTRHDGKKVFLNASVSTLRDEHNETIGYVAVNRDITDAYRVKDILQNEQRLSFALQGAGDGVWEYNFQTHEVYYSLEYKKMLGFKEDEFLNNSKEWRERIHADDLALVAETEEKYDRGEIENHSIEYRIKNKSGNYIWVLDRGMVIEFTDGGKPLKLIGTQSNIDYQKKGEQELVKAKKRLKSFMMNTPTMNWIIDEKNCFRFMNDSYMKAFNLTPDHIGKSLYEIFPAEICDAFIENNWRVWNSNTPLETIEEGVGPDGKKQIYEIFKFPLDSEEGVRLLGGVALDITSNMTNQEQLNLSNERYNYVSKATSDAIWDWDITTDKIYRGEGFKTIFGYTETIATLEIRMSNIIHPDDTKRVRTELELALSEKDERWQSEYRFKCADGGYKEVIDKAYIIRDENGKAIRMIGAVQDVTEQRRLQEQLKKEEERIKKEVMQAIIHAQERERHEISHELHDNISQILTTCKLLLEAGVQRGEQKYFQQTSENIQKAIDEIRSISHRLNPATLRYIGLEGSISDLVNKINNIGNIQINFLFSLTNTDKIHNDIQLAIFRIVQEQLNNVIRHADAGQVIVDLSEQNEKIILLIADDGKGYDLNGKKHGLGLRNIFNRAEFHKGTAQIFTEPGKGFKLQVQIPVLNG
jgi:PAS domain S-box-containing protein